MKLMFAMIAGASFSVAFSSTTARSGFIWAVVAAVMVWIYHTAS